MEYSNLSFESCSSSLSEEEVEEKISVRVDSCLLCAEVAITYDCEGNVIKQEPCSEPEEGEKWSKEELFLFLCRSLGLKHKWKRQKLELEPFPFCQMCQLLINSLAEVYMKLDELEKVLKEKLMGAEEVYLRDNLYEKHSKSYLMFRKDALGVNWKSPMQTVNEDHLQLSRKLTSKRKSSSQSASQTEEVSEVVAETPSSQELLDPEGSHHLSRVLRKRTSPLKYEEPSSEDEVDKVVTPSKKKSKASSPSKTTVKISPKKKSRKRVKKGDVGAESAAHPPVVSPSGPAKASEEVDVCGSQNESEAQSNPLKSKTSKKRNPGRIEKDPTTGNITFTIGFGNRYKSYQGTLIFKLVEGLDGTNWYECSDCPLNHTRFPVFSRKERQRLPFRKHYIDVHSKRHKCQLCPEALNNFGLHSQLVQHLASAHEIFTMNSYYKEIGMPHNLKRTLPGLKYCEICGKPHIGTRTETYRGHLMSHMNDEEKMEALLLGGKRSTYKEIINPTPHQLENGVVAQCTNCGRFITNGVNGMRRHYQDSHPEFVDEKDKDSALGKGGHLCPSCGMEFNHNYLLEIHISSVHRDGNSKFKCKYPSCGQKGWGEDTLKTHVEETHGESQEAIDRVLCLFCGKVLSSAWCLKQHNLVHSGETPFECHLCSKKFPLKSTLKLHLATKHLVGTEMLKCEQEDCGKLFPNLKYFRTHMRKDHGIFLKGKNKREET